MVKLRIATRRSKLAQLQTEHIIEKLAAEYHLESEKILVTTQGDKFLNVSLDKIGGKGLFVKDIEIAMLEKKADAAVHSMKDVPCQIPGEFEIAAVLSREDARDVFVSGKNVSFLRLPSGARIGTSSRRRAMQIQQLRPDIEVIPIRGNVQTRLKKMETEDVDGVILAAAGLKRLGLEAFVTEYFDPQQFVPAVGQGALGIEILRQNGYADLFRKLDDPTVRTCVEAERSFMQALNADCHAAIGAYARIEETDLHIIGIFEISGQLVKKQITGNREDSIQLGQQLAQDIISVTKTQRHGG